MNLSIKNLSKSYGKNKALDNVSLELSCGTYALLGPNGAGKSTLMNILTLGLKQDSGSVMWNDTDINKAGCSYREILGFMPQQQGLYDGFRGVDFLNYIASLKDIPKRQTKSEVERVANSVNLSDRLNDRLSAYSGGMKQRILLAGAIIGNPKLVILDEPTAGLDPKERVRVREAVKAMSEDKIIILATHVVSDIESIAKEVIMLKKGVIVAKAPQQQLCEEYSVNSLEEVYMNVFTEEERQ
ncbi:MAG: ATP-binding cassette domain-containing protein [Oscillospiraceae bacterium]|nr:ATP-binding cassette domain-containing protein [Oscillospiraceae bacterium]